MGLINVQRIAQPRSVTFLYDYGSADTSYSTAHSTIPRMQHMDEASKPGNSMLYKRQDSFTKARTDLMSGNDTIRKLLEKKMRSHGMLGDRPMRGEVSPFALPEKGCARGTASTAVEPLLLTHDEPDDLYNNTWRKGRSMPNKSTLVKESMATVGQGVSTSKEQNYSMRGTSMGRMLGKPLSPSPSPDPRSCYPQHWPCPAEPRLSVVEIQWFHGCRAFELNAGVMRD